MIIRSFRLEKTNGRGQILEKIDDSFESRKMSNIGKTIFNFRSSTDCQINFHFDIFKSISDLLFNLKFETYLSAIYCIESEEILLAIMK